MDGNEYIGYVGTWGPAILGYAHPKQQFLVARLWEAAKGVMLGLVDHR